MLARLHHPAVATLLDYRLEDATHYFISQYAAGVSLEEYLQTLPAPLPLPQCLLLFNRILDGFAYLHRNDVTHGFVHPSLIILLPDGSVQISGFGYLREPAEPGVLDALTFASQRNTYTPPETAAGSTHDQAGDVFSLGVILQEMLMGPSATGSNAKEAGRLKDLPDAIAAIVRKATCSDPKERFPNAIAFGKALQLISTVSPATSDGNHPSALPELPQTKGRKGHRTAARVEIPLLLLVVAATAGFVLRMKTPEGLLNRDPARGIVVNKNQNNGPADTSQFIIPETTIASDDSFPSGNRDEGDSTSDGREPLANENASVKEVAREHMEGYYAALRAQDMETILKFFNPPLNRFFNEQNVEAGQLQGLLRQAWRRTPQARHQIMWNTMRYGKDEAGNHTLDYWMYYHYRRASRQNWQKQIVFTQVKMDQNFKIIYMNGH
jgi:serine/threonine-protein kinase